jgi:hypothetical protein
VRDKRTRKIQRERDDKTVKREEMGTKSNDMDKYANVHPIINNMPEMTQNEKEWKTKRERGGESKRLTSQRKWTGERTREKETKVRETKRQRECKEKEHEERKRQGQISKGCSDKYCERHRRTQGKDGQSLGEKEHRDDNAMSWRQTKEHREETTSAKK